MRGYTYVGDGYCADKDSVALSFSYTNVNQGNPTPDITECENLCNENQDCVGIMYNPTWNECHLYGVLDMGDENWKTLNPPTSNGIGVAPIVTTNPVYNGLRCYAKTATTLTGILL